MKTQTSLVLIALFVSSFAFAQGKEAPCPSNEVLATELLEFEVSGVRVQNAKPNCVDTNKFSNIKAEGPLVAEQAEPPKPLVVSEKRPFTIRSVRQNKEGKIEVKFVWNRGPASDKPVSDTMLMTRYDGPNRKYFGCAVMSVRPKEAAVRPSCLNR